MNVLEWLRDQRNQPSALANFDSGTCMVRATAAALRGESFPLLRMAPRVAGRVLPYGNYLPRDLRQRIYARGGGREAMDPADLDSVRSSDLRQWAVDQYPDRGYPAVIIGSANGAGVHLATLLGIPWLPQTFLLPVRRDNDPNDPKGDFQWGKEPAQRLLEANPDLQLHQPHDPNQDHLMVEYLSYFRVKLLELGSVYEEWLETVLEPGGTIITLECDLEWPTTTVGDRHYFQFGGLGGLSPEEYHEGSDRIAEFLDRRGSTREEWDPPEPDGEAPEAEWGFEPALREDATRFAAKRGYDVRRLSFEDGHALSPLVADYYRERYAENDLPTNRLVVDSFALQDPWWTLRTGSIPYWLPFNTEPDADDFESYLETVTEPYDEIHLMAFSNGVESIGQASIDRWRELLERADRRGRFLGVNPVEYPADYGTYARYHEHFPRQIRDRQPLLSPQSLESFEAFLEDPPREYALEYTGTD